MAKIDTTKIAGYSDMSAEEKLAALEAFEYEDSVPDLQRYKDAVTRANREAAEMKRKYQETLSKDEQAEAQKKEEFERMQTELEALKKERTIAAHKADFLGLGYDDELAAASAQALTDGKMDVVFANQKKYLEAHDKALKAELMKGTSTPPSGVAGGSAGDDYTKKAEAALSAGNSSEAAYFMRLAQGTNRTK